jgi:transcriptional regulator with XRE-family HTH domain
VKAENIGKNIKEILDVLEMPQSLLAKKTGLTCSAISQIIAGERVPSLPSTILILNALNISFERLVR